MDSIASSVSARNLFATSIIARLPPAMLSIGLLVHTQRLTGSFAAAGVVTGVYAVALGVGGPLLGRLVDRRGQTSVLLVSAGVATTLLVAIAVLPAGASLAVLVALAAGIGIATPPVGACLRTQLPALLSDPSAVRAAYALEASVVELTYILGPPLALCLGALWSTGAALAVAGVVLLAATAAFAAQPASRRWRPVPAGPGQRGASLRTPAMLTLVMILSAVGMLLGADEVAVTAAAKALHSTTVAAPLFAVWGAGSFIGGLLVTRLGGGARSAAGLALLLGALTAGHLALIPAAGSGVALGAVLLLAGAAIAPTEATVYAMVDHAAPAGTMTEAFAWLATAMAVGGALGAASAGIVADRAGPAAAFALAGGAGALAMLTTVLRSRTITPRSPSERAQPALAEIGGPVAAPIGKDPPLDFHDLARELTSLSGHANHEHSAAYERQP
jgi:predicted MFS family arabinose efflux permease